MSWGSLRLVVVGLNVVPMSEWGLGYLCLVLCIGICDVGPCHRAIGIWCEGEVRPIETTMCLSDGRIRETGSQGDGSCPFGCTREESVLNVSVVMTM